ncbi:hypothetical protein [Bacillus cereus]|uniref:hypothetical protein n=1 Tax=Bacillus cereus TaxID=1396 RepID=UPI0014444C12|nr:hypothetical protein [Bacillus cereus]NKW87070.1 hypothetical protein [Bacillus cereus]
MSKEARLQHIKDYYAKKNKTVSIVVPGCPSARGLVLFNGDRCGQDFIDGVAREVTPSEARRLVENYPYMVVIDAEPGQEKERLIWEALQSRVQSEKE